MRVGWQSQKLPVRSGFFRASGGIATKTMLVESEETISD